ncbi:hypothetical protein FA95DRAFT_1576353 [Auriscalpium vulgare]|uniref:Uncharacterized protein n=1 Tax=Auriscalpium vulgare TaxID=40419 RepID=A0ACB8RC58_9AGAM|nr:hypothetical protein FA95DRAFT_1576353 [Auriscalpium vulgare]
MDGLDYTICRTILHMIRGARVLILKELHGRQYGFLPLSTVEALEISGSTFPQCVSLSEPLPALRHLCLVLPDWSDDALCYGLTSAGILPQLQSLKIEGREFPPPEILKQLVQLTVLVVRGIATAHSITLPATLQHFGFHAWAAPPGLRAELLVGPLRALPELRLVTVTPCVRRAVGTALEGMCRNKGVDFGMYEYPEGFQQPQHIDWI